jgi:hypothetical protein
MKTQIFKTVPPISLLFNLFEIICIKEGPIFILTNDGFKKGVFHDLIQPFLTSCAEYYHVSKRFYLERKIAYNSFLTVVRQICNVHNISFSSQIKYDKSSYNIVYKISSEPVASGS